MIYEVWTKGYPEDVTRVFVSNSKEQCEIWIEIHKMGSENSFTIREYELDAPIERPEIVYFVGATWNETYDAERDHYQLVPNSINPYRKYLIDHTCGNQEELDKVLGFVPDVLNENEVVLIETKYDGEFKFCVPYSFDRMIKHSESWINDEVTDLVIERLEKFFESKKAKV